MQPAQQIIRDQLALELIVKMANQDASTSIVDHAFVMADRAIMHIQGSIDAREKEREEATQAVNEAVKRASEPFVERRSCACDNAYELSQGELEVIMRKILGAMG